LIAEAAIWACKAEYDGYLHAGNLFAVMQSKSRATLRQKPVRRTGS
jgi:hypothetical protein